MRSPRIAYLRRLLGRLWKFLLTARALVSDQPLLGPERLVRSASDCLVLGYARPNGKGELRTVLDPPSSFRFAPGDAILVIGTLENLKKLRHSLGVNQGR